MKFIKVNHEFYSKNGDKTRGSVTVYVNLSMVRQIEIIHDYKFKLIYETHNEIVYSEDLQIYLIG